MKFNYNQKCIINDIFEHNKIISQEAFLKEIKDLHINCENELKHDLRNIVEIISSFSKEEFKDLLNKVPLDEEVFNIV